MKKKKETPRPAPGALASRRLAWDGVSFRVPSNWELGLYKYLKRRAVRIEIEDEYAVRIEAEWIRPKRELHIDQVVERYEASSKKLTRKAAHKKPIKNLPSPWVATLYSFSETTPDRKRGGGLRVDKHSLVTAFYLAPDSSLFCFLLLHFLPDDTEDPAAVMRLVASDFQHDLPDGMVAWELFDISFQLSREFLLENTLFDVGAKLMIFRWRWRHFFLWHMSCADMFLKPDTDPAEWVAGYLNDSRKMRGGSFRVDENGEVQWKRRWRHVIGHRDEVARWCFRYKVRYKLDEEKNQLMFWVFHHRKDEDLAAIPEALR